MDSPVSATSATPTNPKGRRGNAAGGGKAWNEDEEVYLLQMRLQKVAYKKIAAHLNKTELACRLHYHQLSHGGNRRKRKNSGSSSESASNSPKSSNSMDISKITNPSGNNKRHDSPLSVSAITSPYSTPVKIPTSAPSMNTLNSAIDLQRVTSSGRKHKHLKVSCSDDNVDENKLRRLVEKHTNQLWISVAADYGGGVTPDYLEKVWSSRRRSDATPPTPVFSPRSPKVEQEQDVKAEEEEKKEDVKEESTTESPAKAAAAEEAAAPATAAMTPEATESKSTTGTPAPEKVESSEKVEAAAAPTSTDVQMEDAA